MRKQRLDIFRPANANNHKWLRPYTIGRAESYLPRISVVAARTNIELVRANPLNVPARKLLAQQFAHGCGAPHDVGEAEWLRLTVDRSDVTVQRILHDCDDAERVLNVFAPLFGEYIPSADWIGCWCDSDMWPSLYGPHKGVPRAIKVPVQSVPVVLVYKRSAQQLVLHDSYQVTAAGLVPATFLFNPKASVPKSVSTQEFKLPHTYNHVAVFGYLLADHPDWLQICYAQDLDPELTIFSYRDEEAQAIWAGYRRSLQLEAKAKEYCKRRKPNPDTLRKARALLRRVDAEAVKYTEHKQRIAGLSQLRRLQFHALDALVLKDGKWNAIATKLGTPPTSISVFGQVTMKGTTQIQCVVSAPTRTWRPLC